MKASAAGMALFWAAVTIAAQAQPAPGAAGHWEGELQAPDRKVAVAVDLVVDGEKKWAGAFSTPGEGMRNMPLVDIVVQDNAVAFGLQGIPGDPRFTGTLKEDGTLAGEMTQGGVKMPLTLKRTGDAKYEKPAEIPSIGKELEGTWEGALEVQGRTLRLRFVLANQEKGGAKGTLVSVDQGGVEMPITRISQMGSKVKLDIAAVNGGFEGELKGNQVTGEWSQGANSLPLTITKVEKK